MKLNPKVNNYLLLAIFVTILLSACSAQPEPVSQVQAKPYTLQPPDGFSVADGSRLLTFPADYGAHEDFRTEWWYYTGNLSSTNSRPFGFELTIFRVGMVPPDVELPQDSAWYDRSIYFAHFALSDIQEDQFHAFERYARPGPGLAGAQSKPYRVWLEDWSVAETANGDYTLHVASNGIVVDLDLTDKTGVVLHGLDGYSRKGREISNASYYYSQPRLLANGFISLNNETYPVSGLVWKDHEFSTGVLDEGQIGWDWFSMQFDEGSALMLFQLRETIGTISSSSSGTYIPTKGSSQSLRSDDFRIKVLDWWTSPHSGGVYPSKWQIQLDQPNCLLTVTPKMADQEVNFPAVTYWEGAVSFEGKCDGSPASGSGYIELTGYAGNLPLP